ncbi:MAG: porin [Verrucomicrobiales bacterium]|nr:porin [Verrucomicrobiales bacterium]
MIKVTKNICFAIAIGVSLLTAGAAKAGDKECLIIDDKCPIECKDFKICDIFDKTTLYKNEENCLIQSVKFQGRYHGQYEHIDVDGPRYADGDYWRHRRFRVGTKIVFLNDFTFSTNWNIGGSDGFGTNANNNHDTFNSIEDMSITWKPSDLDPLVSIQVGKVKNKIMREESVSSNSIKTLERSHFVNTYNAQRPWGAEVGLKLGGLKHYFGLWSNSFDQEVQPVPGGNAFRNDAGQNWARWDHGVIGTYRTSYEFNDCTEAHFNYMYTDVSSYGDIANAGDIEAGGSAEHIFSLGTVTESGRFELLTDLLFAANVDNTPGRSGAGQGNENPFGEKDAWGVVILPSYKLGCCERLEIVGRYQYGSFVNDEDPYDNVDNKVGNTNNSDWMKDLHGFYAGLNYYICGDNLKVMAGVEYLTGESVDAANIAAGAADYDATAFSFAVRSKW